MLEELGPTSSVWEEDPGADRQYYTLVRLMYMEFQGAGPFRAELGIYSSSYILLHIFSKSYIFVEFPKPGIIKKWLCEPSVDSIS